MILKTLINMLRCVWLGSELNSAGGSMLYGINVHHSIQSFPWRSQDAVLLNFLYLFYLWVFKEEFPDQVLFCLVSSKLSSFNHENEDSASINPIEDMSLFTKNLKILEDRRDVFLHLTAVVRPLLLQIEEVLIEHLHSSSTVIIFLLPLLLPCLFWCGIHLPFVF